MTESLEISRKARGAPITRRVIYVSALAQIHFRQGNLAEAETEIGAALDIFATTLPADHQYVASAEYSMGEILLATNRLSRCRSDADRIDEPLETHRCARLACRPFGKRTRRGAAPRRS